MKKERPDDWFRQKRIREDQMIEAKLADDLVGMKEVISFAETIEEAYKLARMSENPDVEMYVDALASRL